MCPSCDDPSFFGWLTLSVPDHKEAIEDIKACGGEIVLDDSRQLHSQLFVID